MKARAADFQGRQSAQESLDRRLDSPGQLLFQGFSQGPS